ncbi:MAG: hypothetical protein NC177_12695 [Ruminococcus flavefaciens]|nr:hypothetical protein [Ruminococcus flavefaciens]
MNDKKYIQKKTFKRLKQEDYELSEAEQVIISLELAKEAGDDLWKELILTVLEDMKLMESESYQHKKQNIIRRMNDEL